MLHRASSILVMGLHSAGFCAGFLLVFAALAHGAEDSVNAVRNSDQQQYAAAVAQLREAPQNAANLEKLGQNYFLLGDFRKSIDALEKAAKLDPANSNIQTWLGRAWGRRAESAFPVSAAGYAGKARDAFVKALELDPSSPQALNDLFIFYLQAPGVVGGGLEKANGLLPQLQKHDPVGYHLAKALINQKNKNFDAAETELHLAVKDGPDKVEPLIALGKFLAGQGRYDESDKAFAEARRLEPGMPRVLFAQADSDIRTKRNLDEARDLLKQYIASTDLTPEDPPRWEALKLLKKAQSS
jgi:cytochrome c-type biogenesis protein CcmH/NrfG